MEKNLSNVPVWNVRKYKRGDEHGILKLFTLVGIKRTSEEWLWMYRDNPSGHFIWVGESDGQIVGHVAHIPAHMKIGQRNTTGAQIVDVIVHPKFRHQGMFLAMEGALLEEAEKKGMDITYGFPNKPSGHLKVGGFVVCKVPLLANFVKTREIEENLLERKYRLPRVVIKIGSRIFLITSSMFARVLSRVSNSTENGTDPANVTIRAVVAFDDRIDDFWKKVAQRHGNIVIRNRKYLNWRYCKKPNTKYKILLADEEERILGYIVLRCKIKKNLKLGYIVDILSSSKNVAQSLVSKSIEYFEKENVDSIHCSILKNTEYYKILRYNNFIPVGSTWFMVRLNSSRFSETSLRDREKWYVTMGDGDYV